LRVPQTLLERIEPTFDLTGETRLEHFSKIGPGFESEFDQMATHHQRFRRLIVDGKCSSALQQPISGLEALDPKRRSPALVRVGNPHQSIDAIDLTRQAANCRITRFRAEQLEWSQVMGDEWNDFVACLEDNSDGWECDYSDSPILTACDGVEEAMWMCIEF